MEIKKLRKYIQVDSKNNKKYTGDFFDENKHATKEFVRQEIENNTGSNKFNFIDGKMLYKDPTFIKGLNGIKSYQQHSSIELVNEPTLKSPFGSNVMRIKAISGGRYGDIGGFSFGNISKPNGIFYTRIIANFPPDYKMLYAGATAGSEATFNWLTDNKGTGNWQEYIHIIKCGSTGNFYPVNFFYLINDKGESYNPTVESPLIWHVAYATVFDLTDSRANEEINYSDINGTPTKVGNSMLTDYPNSDGINQQFSPYHINNNSGLLYVGVGAMNTNPNSTDNQPLIMSQPIRKWIISNGKDLHTAENSRQPILSCGGIDIQDNDVFKKFKQKQIREKLSPTPFTNTHSENYKLLLTTDGEFSTLKDYLYNNPLENSLFCRYLSKRLSGGIKPYIIGDDFTNPEVYNYSSTYEQSIVEDWVTNRFSTSLHDKLNNDNNRWAIITGKQKLDWNGFGFFQYKQNNNLQAYFYLKENGDIETFINGRKHQLQPESWFSQNYLKTRLIDSDSRKEVLSEDKPLEFKQEVRFDNPIFTNENNLGHYHKGIRIKWNGKYSGTFVDVNYLTLGRTQYNIPSRDITSNGAYAVIGCDVDYGNDVVGIGINTNSVGTNSVEAYLLKTTRNNRSAPWETDRIVTDSYFTWDNLKNKPTLFDNSPYVQYFDGDSYQYFGNANNPNSWYFTGFYGWQGNDSNYLPKNGREFEQIYNGIIPSNYRNNDDYDSIVGSIGMCLNVTPVKGPSSVGLGQGTNSFQIFSSTQLSDSHLFYRVHTNKSSVYDGWSKFGILAGCNIKNIFTEYQEFRGGYGNQNSDIRYKTDIKEFPNILEEIKSLDIFQYKWNKEGEYQLETFGVDANKLLEMSEPFKRMVHERYDENKTKFVDYDRFGIVAIKGLQELNEKLEKELKDVKEELNELKKLIHNLIER